MTPEELQAIQQDPALAALLNSKQGEGFLAAQQAASPEATAYEEMFAPFAPAASAFVGGYGTSGGPEGAAMANVVAAAGLAANKDYIVHQESGRILYKNGVIYDPETDQVIPPAGKAVPGSNAWRIKVLNWEPAQANKWRGILNDQGYDVAPKGVVDQDFVNALTQYHLDIYRNFGKVVPLHAKADRAAAKQAVDPVIRRQIIDKAFNAIAQDDPTDEEREPFLQAFNELLRMELKRGATPQHAALKAQESVLEKIEDDPQLKWVKAENDENTDMRDAFTSFAQALSAF